MGMMPILETMPLLKPQNSPIYLVTFENFDQFGNFINKLNFAKFVKCYKILLNLEIWLNTDIC